jgi:hypothetical protein
MSARFTTGKVVEWWDCLPTSASKVGCSVTLPHYSRVSPSATFAQGVPLTGRKTPYLPVRCPPVQVDLLAAYPVRSPVMTRPWGGFIPAHS